MSAAGCPRPTRLVVAHYSDGPRATEHATRKSAHAAARSLRASGVPAFSFRLDVARCLGLDPRSTGRCAS